MAGVKSLAVRGIRSFGPDQEDEQRISFESPLTLILGQNGCGKTTIIECLRYAITGQMPPGSRNECFVHDAKVNRSTEVMGQVKLKIVNAKDKLLEVSRSMRVTALAKKKTKFQTLDSFLSLVDEQGNTKDISSRCADLDRFMYEELGVPKAILNSVIFCHQEDSSWPLDEGKKVKERFDEIFDADKYSDCFDRLRKIRKEYSVKLKLLEQEVAFMFEKKQDLDKKKLDVVNTESEISEVELKMGELTQQLKPINEKLLAIEKLQNDLVSFESKKEKSKTKLEHSQTQEKELLAAIKNVFEGTTEELEQKINSYGATAKANQKELEASYRKNTNFNKEEEKIANEKTNNEVKFSKLILLESQNQEKIDKRKELIGETAKLAEIDPPEIESVEDAAKGIDVLNEKIKSLRNELKEMKAEGDAEEKKQQEVVDASLVELSCHRQKITGKEAEIQKVKKDIVKLEKEITAAEKSKEKLDVLEKTLNTAEEAYTQAEKELNTEECEKEIKEDEKVIESYDTELEDLSKKVALLQKQSAKLKERDMIDEQVKQKEKQFAILKNKHRSALVDLLGSVPEEKFAVSLKTYETGLKKEVDAMKRKLKERQMEITRLEADRKHVRESLNNRRTELTNAEDKMYQACGTQNYEATLAKLNSTVEKLQDEQSILNSSMFLIAKYKTQLKDNSCCPLCSRGFENESEVSDLIAQLTTQVMNVPSNLEKVTEELQRTSAKKDELLSMKTLNDKVTSLKEKEIPELETRLADIDKKKATATEASEELSMSLLEPEQKMQTAKDIQGEMPLIDKIIQEIKTANKDLEKAKAQITDVDTDMSLDDATAKQAYLRQKLSTLRARIKDAQKKLNDHAKKLRTLGDKKNKLKEQFLDLQRKVQEIVNLQERRKKCDEDIEKLTNETKELDDGTEAFKQALKTQEDIKAEIIAKHRGLIEAKNTFINTVVSSFEKVKSVDLEIKQHKNKNIPLEMEKIKEANNALMEKQKQIMIDRDALTKRIDALKDELAKQEIYKRDLDDNLKLRKAKADIEICQKELAEIDEKLSGVNTDMLSEKETLIQDQTRLFREKATDMGRLDVLKTNLKHNKIELKKVENKEIDKKYRERFYELHVTKAIDKDVRDYSVALEKCLMEFHKEKMENINLIIRQMWRKIYRGNDIDYIEIKTEGSMTENSERRKYDYRVVQCKNGVEIDMRGRCSAGQKVLACLIIRLALAESFSSKFGILALDEPTTNLDQENVTSLCSALGEIVRERMKQKNFMFIIITHDREFIESLGNIDKVSYYYEVSRNDDGKSRIKRIRFT